MYKYIRIKIIDILSNDRCYLLEGRMSTTTSKGILTPEYLQKMSDLFILAIIKYKNHVLYQNKSYQRLILS